MALQSKHRANFFPFSRGPKKGAAPAFPRRILRVSNAERGGGKRSNLRARSSKDPLRDHYSRAKRGTGSCAGKKRARIFSACRLPRLGRAREKLHAPKKFLLFLPRCFLSPPPLQDEIGARKLSGAKTLQRGTATPMPGTFFSSEAPTPFFPKHGRSGALSISASATFPSWLSLLGSPPPPPPASSGLIRAPLGSSQAEPSKRAILSGRRCKRPVRSPSPPHLPPSPSAKSLFSPPERRLPNSNPRWTHCNMFRPLPALLLAPGHSAACPRASRLDGRPFSPFG